MIIIFWEMIIIIVTAVETSNLTITELSVIFTRYKSLAHTKSSQSAFISRILATDFNTVIITVSP
jgi:hypothetical protein